MSIQSEKTRITNNISKAYTALGNKGAMIPSTKNSANLESTVNTIKVSDVSYNSTTKTVTITTT